MARDFYKQNGSYFFVDNNQKINNIPELQSAAQAGGKEIAPPGTPIPSNAGIERSGGGYKINNNTLDLKSLKNKTYLKDKITQLIQKKQGYNTNLQDTRASVRAVGADTSPFGGMKAVEMAGQFTDERLRQLSPTDQASVRASRDSSLNAWGRGLQEEATYRKTRLDDTLKSVTEFYEEARAQGADERDAEKHALDMAKTRMDLKEQGLGIGYTTDKDGNPIKDTSGSTADQIAEAIKLTEGGVDYNYNIPELGGTKTGRTEIGAYQFMPGTWNSWSQAFVADQNKNLKPGDLPIGSMSLSPTQENQDAVAKWKIQQWLNKGYTPEQVAAAWNGGEGVVAGDRWKGVEGSASSVTGESYSIPKYVSKFNSHLQNIGSVPEQPIELEAWQRTLLQAAGSMKDAAGNTVPAVPIEATRYWSQDDWITFQKDLRDATIEDATDRAIEIAGKLQDKKTQGHMIYSKLQTEYGNNLQAEDLASIMNALGYIKDSYGIGGWNYLSK